MAWKRAREAGGTLVLRCDDLDRERSRREHEAAFEEDLRWLGLDWDEGPVSQSGRLGLYAGVLERLKAGGWVYPCACSRKDVLAALAAPHAGETEPVYPGTCRVRGVGEAGAGRAVSWRMRVPEGEAIEFEDGRCGRQRFVGGEDFGDFVVWRPDGLPSYQLACAVDDALMGITEVVRGEDLLASTARQLLVLRALSWAAPSYFHCELVMDADGRRLAKRDGGMTVRALREAGWAAGRVLGAG